jgi:hypothetical protein
MRILGLVFCFLCLIEMGNAQKGSASSSSSGGGGGGGGGATIEEEAIAYAGVSDIAGKIAQDAEGVLSAEPQESGCTGKLKAILFVDSNSTATSEIAAFYSFNTSVSALKKGYEDLAAPGGPLGAPSPTDWISAAVGLLSALRANAVYVGQTFQPDDTVLITELTKKFKSDGYSLVSSMLPGDLNTASAEISDLLKAVSDARASVPKPAQQGYFDSLDKQFAALQSGLLTGTGAVGGASSSTPANGTILMSIISGRALLDSLSNAIPTTSAAAISATPTTPLGTTVASSQGVSPSATTPQNTTRSTCYAQLFAKTIAAGGSSRTNHNFWVELVYTTPNPSYNGGAIVSYAMLSGTSQYLTGGTLRTVYGYSKWKADKVTTPKDY